MRSSPQSPLGFHILTQLNEVYNFKPYSLAIHCSIVLIIYTNEFQIIVYPHAYLLTYCMVQSPS